MPPPKDSDLPAGVHISELPNGTLSVSDKFVELIVASRSNYDWPEDTGAAKSQKTIIDLETKVATRLVQLAPTDAHAIVREVSKWGGNNRDSQAKIDTATPATQALMSSAIQQIMMASMLRNGLDKLSELPGLRLIMATKVYRFCCPSIGAAADRHASYFFNSLEIVKPNGTRRKATNFRREWANGKHSKSRLAICNDTYHRTNRDEYVDVYLPLLTKIAESLNKSGVTYTCAATNQRKVWCPADVEMAAYYWWARNGPR
jgi:hypothetical protein